MAKPPRSTIHDFDPAVLRLFDQYVHGLIDRRGFLRGATRFAVGAGGAAGLLAALSPQFAALLRAFSKGEKNIPPLLQRTNSPSTRADPNPHSLPTLTAIDYGASSLPTCRTA